MKCKKCGRIMIKDISWEKGKQVSKDICINIKCTEYKPYVFWKMNK